MRTATLLVCLFATVLASAQPRPPHPEPRVIVDALSVRGPHERPAIERAARFGWGKIVGCYNALGRRSRGTVVIDLSVAGTGKVAGSRVKRSTFEPALARCLARAMRRVAMPKARAASTATIEIQLAPGDPS